MFKAADIVFYGFQGTMPRKYTHTFPSSFCSRSQVMSNLTAMTDSCHVIPATCVQLTNCFFLSALYLSNIFKVLVRPWGETIRTEMPVFSPCKQSPCWPKPEHTLRQQQGYLANTEQGHMDVRASCETKAAADAYSSHSEVHPGREQDPLAPEPS